MGRLDFGRPVAYPAPPVAYALHDDDADVIYGDVIKVVDDELSAELTIELKPTLSLRCRWRVPLTRAHNPSNILLLYRAQLDAQTFDQVMVYVKVYGSYVISFIFT